MSYGKTVPVGFRPLLSEIHFENHKTKKGVNVFWVYNHNTRVYTGPFTTGYKPMKKSIKPSKIIKAVKPAKKSPKSTKKLLPIQIVQDLIKARMEAGMSVREVADAMGKYNSQVYGLELGKTQQPALKSLEAYAKAVGKTIVMTLAPSKSSKR